MLKQPSVAQGFRKLLIFCPTRAISGIAPTLFIPKVASVDFAEHEKQIQKNTDVALELLQCIKGAKPVPYTRKHTATFAEISKEVEDLIGSSSKLRRNVRDNEPLDKLNAMERALRHVIWSYIRDEDSCSSRKFEDPEFDSQKYYAEMEKWICYTVADSQRLAAMKEDFERNKRYYQLKKNRLEALKRDPSSVNQIAQPSMDLETEYKNVIDREVVVEKRIRYNNLNIKTSLKNDRLIDAENAAYLKSIQEKRLDQLVNLLESFKPLLAREAILQRLTIKHIEGQLGIWRYLDWNPEVRDRAELEADNCCHQWWMPNEEKRLQGVRLLTKNELSQRAEKKQIAIQQKVAARGSSDDDEKSKQREKILQEIIQLQQRIGRKESEDDSDVKCLSETDIKAPVTEEVIISIDQSVVKEKGLFGLKAE